MSTWRHLVMAVQLLPPQYAQSADSVHMQLLEQVYLRLDEAQATLAALEVEMHPSRTAEFLDEWEEALGLSDGSALGDEERQRRIRAKASDRRDLSRGTIQRVIAEYLGYTPQILELSPSFRTDDPLSLTDAGVILGEYAFQFYVILDDSQLQPDFDYEFGQELLDEIKPAWTAGILAHLGFYTDSTSSLTDRDILAE